MNSSLLSGLLSGVTSTVDVASQACDSEANSEQRRTALNQALAQLESDYAARVADLAKRRKELQDTKYKYENLSDLTESMGQLRHTLDENRRQVKQSEGSLASTGNVLEYDAAKTRSNKLIQIISARVQYERAREALKDAEGEDPARRLGYIVDLHNAHETLQKHLPTPATNQELEELKDGFLAWQSAALIFAIQQADYNKLLEIQKIYQSLSRQEEFTGIFRRVCASRLKELDLKNVDSIQALFSNIYREIEYILDHHLSVIRRFNDEPQSIAIISNAVSEGLESIDLTSVLATIIGQAEHPLELTSAMKKVFADFRERLMKEPSRAKFADLINILKNKAMKSMVAPFKASFTNLTLAKINSVELKVASHRQHIDNLNVGITEVMQLLEDIVSHSLQLFGNETGPEVYHQALERCLDNFAAKLKSWDYHKNSSGNLRSVDDLFLVCSSSGHLVQALQEMKKLADAGDVKLNLKPFTRFNTQCCERILKTATESVVSKMRTAMENIKKEEVDDTHTRNLPLFSISPHEYITNAGQDLLHLFHKFEQFFLDDNVLTAFHIALKKKIEGDEILKSVVADVSLKVVEEFIESVGKVKTLKHAHAKQFLVDAMFLKDALFDLRFDNLDELSKLEAELKEAVDAKK